MIVPRQHQPMRPRRCVSGKDFYPYGKRNDPTRTRLARLQAKARRAWPRRQAGKGTAL